MADEEIDGKLYTWETEYEKTWEILQENEEGSLQPAVDDIIHRAKRRKLLDRPTNVRLGMMRHLFLVVDMSKAMEDQDLKPNRLISSLKLLEHFVEEFFDQNPISQLGIIVTKNKRAEKVMELGGNPRSHINAFQKLKNNSCEGEPSIQNSLEIAGQTLRNMPAHASREVLIIFGSLTTCDPGDIHKTIKMMKTQNIRCSVIGLAANVHVCRKLTTETQGKYHVIMDESHYKDLLNLHLSPPPATANTESSLIKMGFPHHRLQSSNSKEEMVALCMCHLDSKDPQNLGQGGYFCPQCRSKYCELPVECKACGLTLVSAPHLARSYHHLFPLDAFTEIVLEGVLSQSQRFCSACQKYLSEPKGYQCNYCKQIFCIDCDLFIHETLHCCPTCASARGKQTTT